MMRCQPMWGVVLGVMLLAAPPVAAQQQAQTLADIRQQLSVVFVEVQRLKRELSTTGGVVGGEVSGGSTLQRVDAIERQLQQLTAKTERLEHRITQVVSDGTNRIGDLEFRLCELETGCDTSKLGDTPMLGGIDLSTAAPALATPQPDAGGGDLAVGEQADFDAAKAALDAGDFQGAVKQFADYTETYPGGPLSADAHFFRGKALTQLGQTADAARAYLKSFSGAPNGTHAAGALYGLGLALQDLGQTNEACVTLAEVGSRFPDAPETIDADAARQTIGCN